MSWRVLEGACVERMREFDEASVDAIVCDPPYSLGFMGAAWDLTGVAFQVGTWIKALRVLKPGGHLLSFGGTRTYHRLACAIEDAGFEIRDSLIWIYGSGFPKSHNGDWGGTALKPAHETIVMARKPLAGTVEANWRQHGTGALNIDATRIESEEQWDGDVRSYSGDNGFGPGDTDGWSGNWSKRSGSHADGRWPANVILGLEAAEELDRQSGELASGSRAEGVRKGMGYHGADGDGGPAISGDTGGAARFFYVAKASRAERNAGLDGEVEYEHSGPRGHRLNGDGTPRPRPRPNSHPTVKPIDLMRWLVRLVTPPGGTVLDPFAGSGTTGIAALLEGFDFIGIEREPAYVEIARARLAWWSRFPPGTDTEAALGYEARERQHRETGQTSLLDEAA